MKYIVPALILLSLISVVVLLITNGITSNTIVGALLFIAGIYLVVRILSYKTIKDQN